MDDPLWKFFDNGSKLARCLAENQNTHRKSLHFINKDECRDVLSKNGHDLKKYKNYLIDKSIWKIQMIEFLELFEYNVY